ncbi:MAG: hypothetical protein ACJ72W_06305 [Actinoallomurus sp.]
MKAAYHARVPYRVPREQILRLYDLHLALAPSPIVALNRAVAVAEVAGPGPALALVDDLELDRHHVPRHPGRPAPARGL